MMALHLKLKLTKPSTVLKSIVQPLKGNCPHDEGILHKKSPSILNSAKTQGPPNKANCKQLQWKLVYANKIIKYTTVCLYI